MTFPTHCGRLDRHDEHDWTTPREPFQPQDERTYHCGGRLLIEGGYWADWDAQDDAAEERMDREKREEWL